MNESTAGDTFHTKKLREIHYEFKRYNFQQLD